MLRMSLLHSKPIVQEKSLWEVQSEQFANGPSLNLGYYSGTPTKLLLEAALPSLQVPRDAGDIPQNRHHHSLYFQAQKHILSFFFYEGSSQAQVF